MLSKTHPEPLKLSRSSSGESKKKRLSILFEPLNKDNKDSRKNFTCGAVELDQYLQRNAFQDQKRHLARVFLGLNDQQIETKLVVFYTLSAATIDRKDLPRGDIKPYEETPAVRIGRLAVSSSYQKQGLGEETLFEILSRYLRVCELIGSVALVVDAYKNSEAFYKKFGFRELLTHKKGYKALYLLTKTIKSELIRS